MVSNRVSFASQCSLKTNSEVRTRTCWPRGCGEKRMRRTRRGKRKTRSWSRWTAKVRLTRRRSKNLKMSSKNKSRRSRKTLKWSLRPILNKRYTKICLRRELLKLMKILRRRKKSSSKNGFGSGNRKVLWTTIRQARRESQVLELWANPRSDRLKPLLRLSERLRRHFYLRVWQTLNCKSRGSLILNLS